jgi:hypothetical protein
VLRDDAVGIGFRIRHGRPGRAGKNQHTKDERHQIPFIFHLIQRLFCLAEGRRGMNRAGLWGFCVQAGIN